MAKPTPSVLTKAQIANLISVRDTGHSTRRSRSGHWCRVNGLTAFLWLFTDGAIATTSEKQPGETVWLKKVVGECLTEAGRLALAQLQENDDDRDHL